MTPNPVNAPQCAILAEGISGGNGTVANGRSGALDVT
jgi:hypothetical protein